MKEEVKSVLLDTDGKTSLGDEKQQKEAMSSDFLAEIKKEVLEDIQGSGSNLHVIGQVTADLKSLKKPRLRRDPDPDADFAFDDERMHSYNRIFP